MPTPKQSILFANTSGRNRPVTVPENAFFDYFGKDSKSLAKKTITRRAFQELSLPEKTFNAKHMPEDLHLDIIVKELLGVEYCGPFVQMILASAPTDSNDLLFRRRIMSELFEGGTAKTEFDEMHIRLRAMAKVYQDILNIVPDSEAMADGYYAPSHDLEGHETALNIMLLHSYIELLEKMKSGEFVSGVSNLKQYSGELMGTQAYKRMADFVRVFSEDTIVSAFVTLKLNRMGGVSSTQIETVNEEQRRGMAQRMFAKANPVLSWILTRQVRGFIQENYDNMLQLLSYLAEFEFYAGALNFSRKLEQNAMPRTLPNFEDGKKTDIRALHNPLILVQEREEGEPLCSIPNDVYFDERNRLYVLTGPNDSGKSFFLTAVALGIVLAQNAYPIPAESAVLSPVDNVFTHFIPKADVRKAGGRYRSELRQLRYIVEAATPRSLILLDEPCGGTDSGQGVVQSIRTVRALNRIKCKTLFCTHMHPVSDEIDKDGFDAAHNLQVQILFEPSPKLTHKVIPGKAGQSYGEVVAREEGVDDASLEAIISSKSGSETEGRAL